MTILVESKRKRIETLARQHPDAVVIDVTSHGLAPWVRFSPFYPHGDIPVPLSPGYVAASVEGIWQGLKVFPTADVDTATFAIANMRGIKRTVRSYGMVRGHRAGVHGTRLLSYREARERIYLPAYRWVLDHCVQDELARLRDLSERHTLILLDFETNSNIDNLMRPLSHAALVGYYLTDQWPAPVGVGG